MGCGGSKTVEQSTDPELAKANSISSSIERDLAKERDVFKKTIKMLMLGAGESGKSTVLTQIELIHGKKYSQTEREAYKDVIFMNTIQSMQVVIDALSMFKIELPEDLRPQADRLIALGDHPESVTDEQDDLSAPLLDALVKLWAHPSVKRSVSLSHEFQLNDSAPYFFDALERLGAKGYTPTTSDILRSRVKTTGIREIRFKSDARDWHCFDVGGQRSERKKWIHCFEGVNVVMFVLAISEYNQMLYEDETIARMDEAAMLFDNICNSHWFNTSLVVLLLNKTDLFREKIKSFPLSKYIKDYAGPDTYEGGCEYMKNRFSSLAKGERKSQLFTHLTCATDTKAMGIVFAAVNERLLVSNMQKTGML